MLGAIDCGTNSTRVLVGDGHTTVDRRMTITRLGAGVDRTRRLDPAAIDRTVSVLKEYRRVLDEHGVTRVRMTATSAARDATNRDDFFDAAEAVIGARPELLSGDEEGALSFRGAVSDLDATDGPFLVVDIGGGSTEIVVGRDTPAGMRSLDLGCVRVTEKFLHSDPPRPEELANAIGVVHDALDDVTRDVPAVLDAARFVGLAGTVTTMAAVEIGLAEYDRDRIHHFELTRRAAEDVFRTLATEARAARVHNPGLEEARADVIVGGALILVTIMRHFGFETCLVSEADILDGLILSML
jgi:exopolyphosphatase/guanosine-5'-triphosphate,3'-diphosphate pyrophosphatase